MGGLLDSTNIIKSPLAAVITSISKDHSLLLGDTIEEIAKQKSGIIKQGINVVSSVQKPEVKTVIEEAVYK